MKNKIIFTLLLIFSSNAYSMQICSDKYGVISTLPEELIQHIATSVDSIINENDVFKIVIKNVCEYLNLLKSLNKNFYNLINHNYILQEIGKKLKIKFNVNQELIEYLDNSVKMRNDLFLTMAIRKGNMLLTKLLIYSGAGICFKGNISALMIAADQGHSEIAELLLAEGTNINMQTQSDNETALIAAALNGHKDIVKLLLDNRAAPNIQDVNGLTALMIAAYKGHKEIVRLLLNKYADPNIQSVKGYTALICAAEQGHKEIVELLLNSGARNNLISRQGFSASDYAFQHMHIYIHLLILKKEFMSIFK